LQWRLGLREITADETDAGSDNDIARDWEEISSWLKESGGDKKDAFIRKLYSGFYTTDVDLIKYKLEYDALDRNATSVAIHTKNSRLEGEWANLLRKSRERKRLQKNIQTAGKWLSDNQESKQFDIPKSQDLPETPACQTDPCEPPRCDPVVDNIQFTDKPTENLSPVQDATTEDIQSFTTPLDKPTDNLSLVQEAATEVIQPPTITLDKPTDNLSHVEEAAIEVIQPPAIPQWNYLPVPEDIEKHDEFYTESLKTPEHFIALGARVRGKKHKHEGTNCDDWFEFAVAGPWTIIAVADGAGAKKLSRLGAKEACKAVINHLSIELKEHELHKRDAWTADTFKRDSVGIFAEDDIEFVQKAIHGAMRAGYDALDKKAGELHNSTDHYIYIGKKRPDIKDLSTTLLVAVHSTVNYKGCSFVMTCHIGDGMIAAIVDLFDKAQLLAIPDIGEFAGETEMLTSKIKVEPGNLAGKTFPFFSPLRALFVMTDGVADDYFPNDRGMLKLYCDLVLNGIIRISEPSAELSAKQLLSLESLKDADISALTERVTAENPRPKIKIKSVQKFAEALGYPLPDVMASPALLWAGSRLDAAESVGSGEAGLQVWLDTYQIKGSFDDRTLVILCPEKTI
jgi:hypothetical protein